MHCSDNDTYILPFYKGFCQGIVIYDSRYEQTYEGNYARIIEMKLESHQCYEFELDDNIFGYKEGEQWYVTGVSSDMQDFGTGVTWIFETDWYMIVQPMCSVLKQGKERKPQELLRILNL